MWEGGLYTTATDLLVFYQMMLNGGTYNCHRILSHPTVETMASVQTGDLRAGDSPGMAYGLGWAIIRFPMGSIPHPLISVGNFGHGGYYGTYAWVDPVKDMIELSLIQRIGNIDDPHSDERKAFMAIASSRIVR